MSYFATEYTFSHLGLDPALDENITMGYYEAGHMMYIHLESLIKLKEDLAKGYKRDLPFQLPDFNVIALNVTKLRGDNIDPKVYMARVEDWRGKVEKGGGLIVGHRGVHAEGARP